MPPFQDESFSKIDDFLLGSQVEQQHVAAPQQQQQSQQQNSVGAASHRQRGLTGAIDFLSVDQGQAMSARPPNYGTILKTRTGSSVNSKQSNQTTSPEQLKGKPLVDQVNKLSNWGFSLNLRFLKLNKKGLAYFSHIPAEEFKSSADKVEEQKDQYKPKETVPHEAILEVAPISQDERQANKKFFKSPEIQVFKVVFVEKEVKKKTDLIVEQGELQQQSTAQLLDLEDDNNDADGLEEEKESKDKGKGVKVWWFSLVEYNLPNKVPIEDWVLNISIFAKKANNSFKLCDMARMRLQQLKQQLQNQKFPPQLMTTVQQPKIGKQQMQQPGVIQKFTLNPDQQNQAQKQKNKERIDQFTDANQDLLKQAFLLEENKQMSASTTQITDRQNSEIHLSSSKVGDKAQQESAQYDKEFRRSQTNNKQSNQRTQMPQRECDDTDKDVYSFYERGKKKQSEKHGKENRSWDLKFQKFTGYVINAQHDIERSFKLSERLLDHVREFRKIATNEVVKIVDGLGGPLDKRISKPLKDHRDIDDYIVKTMELFCDEDLVDFSKNDHIFFEPQTHNMIIKMTYPTDTLKIPDEHENTNETQGGEEDNQSNDSLLKGDNLHRQLYKQYAREMLSRDVIYDAIFISTKDVTDKDRLRVPLSVMVDYKGFRAMAIGYVGLDAQELRLGYRQGNYFTGKRIDDLIQELRNIGIVLNLKENRFHQSTSQQAYKRIPVSTFIQIYANTSGQRETKSDEEQDEVLKYFFDHHFKDLDYDKEPQNYIMRTGEIFPYDIDPLDSNMDNFHRDKVLRPELVCANEKSLRADIKKKISYAQKKTTGGQNNQQRSNNQTEKDNEDNTDAVDLNLANKFLRDMKIPQLVSLLDSLIIIPIDSATLEEAFHIQGVNMRYLGSVASLSKLKHVKDLCYTDMLARTLKRFFNTVCSELIIENHKLNEDVREKRNEINVQKKKLAEKYKNDSNATQIPKRKQEEELANLQKYSAEIAEREEELKKDIDIRVKEWVLDFMNLIFGEGDETRKMWDEVLLPRVSMYYNFDLMELRKFETNLNALYYALAEQLNLRAVERDAESYHTDEGRPRNTFHNHNTHPASQRSSYKNNIQSKQALTQRDIDPFFKLFEKSSEPFGSLKNGGNQGGPRYEFELFPKTRTYKFRNLMYNSIAQKFRDLKNNGTLVEAYETCKMRKHMNKCLQGEEGELQTTLDLCQLQLEDRQWDSAKRLALKAKEELLNRQRSSHAAAIKFQTILMQAYYMSGQFQHAEKEFTEALKILDHHWGPYHPLHISIYGVMAQLLILNQKYEDATYLYKASLRCCMRIIGPNHIQTGEVHMDYARLQLTKANVVSNTSKGLQQKSDSLQHFMEAFHIFKNYFDSEKQDALQTAEAAIEIANLLEADSRMQDAFPYSQVASQTYREVYAPDNARIIEAMWRELSIAYSIEWMKTEDLAADLFYALAKRDHIVSIGDIQTFERFQAMQQAEMNNGAHGKDVGLVQKGAGGGGGMRTEKQRKEQKAQTKALQEQLQQADPDNSTTNAAISVQQSAEKTEQRINEIKANLIATIIMEKTRSLKKKQKKKVKAFCDKILFDEMFDQTEGESKDNKERKDNIINNLEQFHYTNMNPLRILSVRSLDIQDQASQLLVMYNQAVSKIDWQVQEDPTELEHRKFIFHQKYENMIKQVEEKANELKLSKKNNPANANYGHNYDDNATRNQGGGIMPDPLSRDVNRPFIYEDGGILDGKFSQDDGGAVDPSQRETCNQFFHKLIKIFKNINFYNLLDIKQELSNKDLEQLGNDDQ